MHSIKMKEFIRTVACNMPDMSKRPIHIIGACVNKGQPHPGTRNGPKCIMSKEGLIRKLCQSGEFRKVTHEYIQDGALDKVEWACDNSERAQDEFTLTIGGDHSVSEATVRAARRRHGPGMGLVLVDAHGDLNNWNTSPTGNTHGMWLRKTIEAGVLDYQDVVLVGTNDLDYQEKVFIERNNILMFSMNTIDSVGIDNVMAEVTWHLDKVNPNRPGVHLSFDVDALCPTVAPSTGTPVLGGLTLKEGKYIASFMRDVWGPHKFTTMDMVEFNPLIGRNPQLTAHAAIEIISDAVMGEKTIEYNPNFKD